MVRINGCIEYRGKDLGEESEKITQEILNLAMNTMRNEAIINAPADTTELREKIQLEEKNPNNYVLNSNARHSEPIEYGSKPFWAPIAPLKEWANRKFGEEDIGYAVQKKIAKKGITAHPFMRPALDKTQFILLPKIARDVKAKYS